MTAIAAFGLWLLCSALNLEAQETNDFSPAQKDLSRLIDEVNAKTAAGKTNQTDFADQLKKFDALLATHKDAPEKERAEILLMKSQLFRQVLDQPEQALEVLRQFKRDFPNLQIGGSTDEALKALEREAGQRKIQQSLAPGRVFPEFHENDIHGKPLSLADYRGKVVLVDFWATWCMTCLITLPELQEAHEKFHARGFDIIGVSLDQDLETLKRFIKQKELPWRQYCDGNWWDSKLALKYGIDAAPTTYLLDRDGKIIGRNLTGQELNNAIAKALSEKSSPPAKRDRASARSLDSSLSPLTGQTLEMRVASTR